MLLHNVVCPFNSFPLCNSLREYIVDEYCVNFGWFSILGISVSLQSIPCVFGFVVDNMFCGGYLVCHLIVVVVVVIGKCYLMAVAIRPGQPVK